MEGIVARLAEVLPSEQILQGEALKQQYYHIWRMHESLHALAYVMPTTTAELSSILAICNEWEQPVVVYGGRTNLVGSTETDSSELVISLEKMNAVLEVDASSRTITVQAGVILEEIQRQADNQDLLFPLNFGAKGSAQIGGIISTNAGGLRVLRFGMTRQLVLGLEAVKADGSIISSMKKIIKDNSAYDLKQLFIGSEGTLGIITKAVLKLVEKPISRCSAFVAVESYDNVVTLLKQADKMLGGTLSGFELIWGHTYNTMTSAPSLNKPPLPHGSPFYVLLESLGSDPAGDQLRIERLLANCIEVELITDAVVAASAADHTWFWNIREDVHVLVSQMIVDQHFDISLPVPLIGSVIQNIWKELQTIEDVRETHIFGHVADGNIHLMIGKTHNDSNLTEVINEIVYRPLQAIGGSISAEHGIGLHKKKYLSLCRSEAEISMMQLLKKSLDPKNILNRNKVLDL